MRFGEAIELLKDGKRVRRSGWNGKGMWLALTPATQVRVDGGTFRGAAAKLVEHESPDLVLIGGHIDMRAADGTLVIGWLASQADMLSEDWELVD